MESTHELDIGIYKHIKNSNSHRWPVGHLYISVAQDPQSFENLTFNLWMIWKPSKQAIEYRVPSCGTQVFITLNKVGLTFKSVNKNLLCDHWNESYWAVRSCGTVSFKSVDETLECDHLNESSVLSSTFMWSVYYAVQGGSNF